MLSLLDVFTCVIIFIVGHLAWALCKKVFYKQQDEKKKIIKHASNLRAAGESVVEESKYPSEEVRLWLRQDLSRRMKAIIPGYSSDYEQRLMNLKSATFKEFFNQTGVPDFDYDKDLNEEEEIAKYVKLSLTLNELYRKYELNKIRNPKPQNVTKSVETQHSQFFQQLKEEFFNEVSAKMDVVKSGQIQMEQKLLELMAKFKEEISVKLSEIDEKLDITQFSFTEMEKRLMKLPAVKTKDMENKFEEKISAQVSKIDENLDMTQSSFTELGKRLLDFTTVKTKDMENKGSDEGHQLNLEFCDRSSLFSPLPSPSSPFLSDSDDSFDGVKIRNCDVPEMTYIGKFP